MVMIFLKKISLYRIWKFSYIVIFVFKIEVGMMVSLFLGIFVFMNLCKGEEGL